MLPAEIKRRITGLPNWSFVDRGLFFARSRLSLEGSAARVHFLGARHRHSKVTPIETSAVPGANGVAVVRIAAFSQETGKQLVDAVRSVTPADALIIDVRGNAGGYMPAGVEAAKVFLPPNALVTTEVGRDGVAKPYLGDGIGSETKVRGFACAQRGELEGSRREATDKQSSGVLRKKKPRRTRNPRNLEMISARAATVVPSRHVRRTLRRSGFSSSSTAARRARRRSSRPRCRTTAAQRSSGRTRVPSARAASRTSRSSWTVPLWP